MIGTRVNNSRSVVSTPRFSAHWDSKVDWSGAEIENAGVRMEQFIFIWFKWDLPKGKRWDGLIGYWLADCI